MENQPNQVIIIVDGKEEKFDIPLHGEMILTIAENKVKFVETRVRKKM